MSGADWYKLLFVAAEARELPVIVCCKAAQGENKKRGGNNRRICTDELCEHNEKHRTGNGGNGVNVLNKDIGHGVGEHISHNTAAYPCTYTDEDRQKGIGFRNDLIGCLDPDNCIRCQSQ